MALKLIVGVEVELLYNLGKSIIQEVKNVL
jgi:hypothetical protein